MLRGPPPSTEHFKRFLRKAISSRAIDHKRKAKRRGILEGSAPPAPDEPATVEVVARQETLYFIASAVNGLLALENLVLRQQLAVLKHRHPRPRLTDADRLFWVVLSRI